MKRSLIVLLTLILLGAVLNVPIAIQFVDKQTKARTAYTQLFGTDAAQRGWPSPPPLPWPEVSFRSDATTFGHRQIDARAVEGSETTHSMQLDLYGWPFAAVQERQLWWPWDDPKWSTNVPHSPGVQLRWSGVVLNPILYGLAVWLVFYVPFVASRAIRGAYRRRKGRCVNCGYPTGVSVKCTECGHVLQDNLQSRK
ncbi:MAG: hypothetical protein IIB53_13045 [Planctomycetes bacterium]|nr:hypothetical protein [Planctomycetota bacterium]